MDVDGDLDVDGDRLRGDIEANAAFGAIEAAVGRGRTVLTGTEADRRARDYLVERLEDAGLDVRFDAVGNVAGRWCSEAADPDADPVAAGSHLDSVPEGGIFDGPLGVYAALEAVRALKEADVRPARPVEVVSFTEEEGGRFSNGLLGSSVAAGHRSIDDALALADADGVRLDEGLESIGYWGEGLVDAAGWDAWLELHVEQDTRLEGMGVPVGVVTTVTGITHCRVQVRGEANHAGATHMRERRDALTAAAEFVLDVERAARELVAAESDTAVATVGRIDVEPNAVNVVPGRATLGLDVRDVEAGTMDALVEQARESLRRLEADRGVETDLELELDLAPTPLSDRCQRALHDAGRDASVETVDLPSLAAHDTMHVAAATDAAMLFAPSEGGISHNPREWTDWSDCAAATRVLAGGIARLAG